MVDHNIIEALRVVRSGLVRHAHPFTWDCAEGARHVDMRTLQRALQRDLIRVEVDARREFRPVTLTDAGLQRLAGEEP